MRTWLSLWETRCELSSTRSEFEDQLPTTASKTESENYQYGSSTWNGVFDLRYEWKLDSGPGYYRVTERAYVDWKLFILTAISAIAFLLGAGFTSRLPALLSLISFVSTFVLLILFGGFVATHILIESPVHDLLKEGRNRARYIPLASFMAYIGIVTLLYTQAGWVLQLLLVFSVAVAATVYIVFHDRVVAGSIRWQDWLLRRSTGIPLIAGNYVAGLLLASTVQGLFLVSTRIPEFELFLQNFAVVFPLLYSGIIVFLLLIMYGVMRVSQGIESVQFDRFGQTDVDSTSYLLTGLVVVSSSGLYGFLSYIFIRRSWEYVHTVGGLGTYLVAFLSAIPILYYGMGLVYQSASFLYANILLLRSHRSPELERDQEFNVRVLDSEALFAGSVSWGFLEFIMISSEMEKRLEENELNAVLAHEEAHLQTGDSSIAFWTGLLASLVFTGKNILFGVLGFREREFRADRYAVEKVGKDNVIQALNTLQKIEYDTESSAFPGFIPTMTAFRPKTPENLLEQVFGFYFGDFALSGVHPSITERKETVRRL